MVKYKISLYEWDMNNGEYLYRDYYGDIVNVKDEEELWRIIDKRLNEIVEEAKEEDWECEEDANGSLICSKRCEEEYIEGTEEECIYQREIGYDIEEVKD